MEFVEGLASEKKRRGGSKGGKLRVSTYKADKSRGPSAIDLAIFKLKTELSTYPGIETSIRNSLIYMVNKIDPIRYLNMKTMAGVLVILNNIGTDKITNIMSYIRPEHFTDDIMEKVMSNVDNSIRGLDREQLKDRFIMSMISYMKLISQLS